ncbi:chorismate-binding protein [Cellulomonas rhizosphaerae]|uniref:Anthranilate synthase component I family protein n=1 Tax=Cellulomonas rhizosphaerae TaxID=2293719 RepID=A0A413RM03_9CELL|nr:anthranilate synthase component I family protein [Cellulomonas rhizosphaerae]RHA41349.1 anthranilate synthase component I family protein [Cellulomonas rhizosphaerae]
MPDQPPRAPGRAWFAGVELAGVTDVIDVCDQPERLREPGWWVVVGEFDGRVRAWRFDEATSAPEPAPHEPVTGTWRSSLDHDAYVRAVEDVRGRILEGDVYQANICRVMSVDVPQEPDARALAHVLARGNPAPYAGGVQVDGAWVVCASPELYLRIDGDVVTSAPIKGTAPTRAGLTAKDRAENVMITDLVRNDLQHVCEPGTVEVTTLLGIEEHPGLAHLVSTVQGRLVGASDDDLWARLLDATYPPGSVSGAPKSSALRIIGELEPVERGPYCGAFGWVHVDDDGRTRAELAVAIRTFWWADGVLRFGTGAGITWGSDAEAEWAETQLKAARLVGLASGTTDPVTD